MQKNDSTLDDLLRVKAELDNYYADFLRRMEYAIDHAFADTYEHVLVSLSLKREALDAVSQQFAGSEMQDKLALSLKYLFTRFSEKIMSESLDQIFENALTTARGKYKSHFPEGMATNPNAFLSIYDPDSRFQMHLN
jgi:molecular chaperone GrpE (heat shock protein)